MTFAEWPELWESCCSGIDLYFSETLGLSLHEFMYLRKIPIMFQKQ